MARRQRTQHPPIDPMGPQLIKHAFARVTAHLDRLDRALARADVAQAQAIQAENRLAVDQLRVVVEVCGGPALPWERMPPHMAKLMKELLRLLIEPPKPAKARLKSRIVKGAFLFVAVLAEAL